MKTNIINPLTGCVIKKFPSVSEMKKTLHEIWAFNVKRRDKWRCALCGATDNLTAHHWCVNAQNSRISRYDPWNGITLCYACHIHGIHTRADWATVSKIENFCSMSYIMCEDQYLSLKDCLTSMFEYPVDTRTPHSWRATVGSIIDMSERGDLVKGTLWLRKLWADMVFNKNCLYLPYRFTKFENREYKFYDEGFMTWTCYEKSKRKYIKFICLGDDRLEYMNRDFHGTLSPLPIHETLSHLPKGTIIRYKSDNVFEDIESYKKGDDVWMINNQILTTSYNTISYTLTKVDERYLGV